MARIRTIKPKFWDDIKIGRLPRDVRLLYIGMWNFADDLGVVISDPVWLKSKIFPYDQIQLQQFESWLEVLEKTGFISLLTVKSERFYYLPTFSRHQVINKPNLEDVNISKSLLNNALQQITDQSRIDTGSIPDQSRPIVGEEEDKDITSSTTPPVCACEDEVLDNSEQSDKHTSPQEEKSCAKKEEALPRLPGGAIEYIPATSVAEYLKGDTYWLEALCMNRHLEMGYVTAKIDEFEKELQNRGEATKDKRDCKQHFNNWLRKNREIHESRTTTSTDRGSAPDITNDEIDRRCADRLARRLANSKVGP